MRVFFFEKLKCRNFFIPKGIPLPSASEARRKQSRAKQAEWVLNLSLTGQRIFIQDQGKVGINL